MGYGCGGGDAPKCPRPDGNFLVTYTEMSGGDCGAIDSQIRALYAGVDRRPICLDAFTFLDDGCSLNRHSDCHLPLPGTTTPSNDDLAIVETYNYASEKEWSGVADFSFTPGDGTMGCHSIYSVTALRQ